jgi:hypothetical protein
MTASTFAEMVRYLYRQQTTAFKINLSFGFILRNIVTGVLRYYHSSQNNARFFDVSHLFRIEDLERFLEELSRHDILEYIRQQMGVTPPRTDLYRRCHLQVSWWRVPFTTDRIRFELIGRKWRLLIGQISWLSIGWRGNTSQSFYHPIIGCSDVTGSIWIMCTIGLCEHIQSTCIHYAVFKYSRYDSVVYCYTVHLDMNSSHINIYIYSKATLHLSRFVTGSIYRGCINLPPPP